MVVAVACYKCAPLERAAAWGVACLNRTATDATVWSAEPVRAAARGGSGQVGQECADRTATHAPIDKMSFSELVVNSQQNGQQLAYRLRFFRMTEGRTFSPTSVVSPCLPL